MVDAEISAFSANANCSERKRVSVLRLSTLCLNAIDQSCFTRFRHTFEVRSYNGLFGSARALRSHRLESADTLIFFLGSNEDPKSNHHLSNVLIPVHEPACAVLCYPQLAALYPRQC